ncbi:MAG: hypothetical protein WCP01_17315 [Methylococcaceae bacterium]
MNSNTASSSGVGLVTAFFPSFGGSEKTWFLILELLALYQCADIALAGLRSSKNRL